MGKGENPVSIEDLNDGHFSSYILFSMQKIIIVNRRISTDKDGIILPSSGDVDLEVRDIWQPWLQPRCNFAVRYIVPDRVNIIKALEEKGRFSSEVGLYIRLYLLLNDLIYPL